MNRDKDFHKKASGILINKNTKDYRRAKNRNVVMKTTIAALGEDGTLDKVNKKVDDFTSAPSRAEERVNELEIQLADQKVANDEIKTQLAATLEEYVKIKDRLQEANSLNQDINDKLVGNNDLKNDLLKLKQLVESMESN